MFSLDENFLKSVGLDGMSEQDKVGFLQYTQEELENRVGERLSEGLSEAQMEEFEKIASGDKETVDKILAENGFYKADPVYKMMVEQSGYVDGASETLEEYVSMKWMMQNRPDYKEIVEAEVAKIRKEIEADRDKLLAGK